MSRAMAIGVGTMMLALSGCWRPGPAVDGSPPSSTPAAAQSSLGDQRARQVGLLVEANDAFDSGDDRAALVLYQQVVEIPEAADEPRELKDRRDFARFRMVVVDARTGKEDDARSVLDELRSGGERPFARLGLLFWDTYGMTAEVAAACRQVNAQVRDDPDRFGAILRSDQGLGLSPDQICPSP